jgi:putative hydrolase of the HAD superfamily
MIKTLLFDFGDVFLSLDKSATQTHLNRFGISEFSEEMTIKNKAYEMGLISTKDFVAYYTEKFPQLSELDFIHAWNSILLDFPKHKLDFIKNIASDNQFELILLSNTNDLHIQWVEENIALFREFKACFDAFYLSHEIELRKPNEDIYQFILENHSRKPEEILFVDDTKENTDAAAKLGFHTWHLQAGKEDVVDLFNINRHLI